MWRIVLMKILRIITLLLVGVLFTTCVTYSDKERLRKSDFGAFESWHKINAQSLTGDADGALQGKHLENRGVREVYVNSIGKPIIEGTDKPPFPEGTIIVKDTFYITKSGDRGRRWNITVMRKREAGYDPDNGDWEYVTAGPGKGVRYQGKMPLCIECHVDAERDYVFTWN